MNNTSKKKTLALTATMVALAISLSACHSNTDSAASEGTSPTASASQSATLDASVEKNLTTTSTKALSLLKDTKFMNAVMVSLSDENYDFKTVQKSYAKELKSLDALYEKDKNYKAVVAEVEKRANVDSKTAELINQLTPLALIYSTYSVGSEGNAWDKVVVDESAFSLKDDNLVPVKSGYISLVTKDGVYSAVLNADRLMSNIFTFNKNGSKLTSYDSYLRIGESNEQTEQSGWDTYKVVNDSVVSAVVEWASQLSDRTKSAPVDTKAIMKNVTVPDGVKVSITGTNLHYIIKATDGNDAHTMIYDSEDSNLLSQKEYDERKANPVQATDVYAAFDAYMDYIYNDIEDLKTAKLSDVVKGLNSKKSDLGQWKVIKDGKTSLVSVTKDGKTYKFTDELSGLSK